MIRIFKQRTSKPTKIPNKEDLYWAAGFLEGEGSFTNPNNSEQARASQADDNKEPLIKLQELFGGSIYHKSREKQRKQGKNYKDQIEWGLYGARARGLMMTLYVLLGPRKQEQIRNSLKNEKQ